MIDDQEIHDASLDLREETSVTRLPGFVATEHIVHDAAAERRLGHSLRNRILWSLLGFLEILLFFRVLLRLIGADPNSGFAMMLFGVTGIFVGPFNGMIPTPTSGDASLEVTTLIAMVVYALIYLGIRYIIQMFARRAVVRSFTRTTRELTPGGEGNVRTTHTSISDGDVR